MGNLDEEQKNWTEWQQEYWPMIYLVDKQGTLLLGRLVGLPQGQRRRKLAQIVEPLLAE